MDYKVLYRKYRPQTFDEVVGQDNTIKLLKDSIVDNKISHAYVFSGPRGTGKTSTAKIFAKAINCSNSSDGNPCNCCDSCNNYKYSSDIYEIDAASNNGVDQIREIIDNVKLSPVTSKYKVYIIDEVHMLSTSAFNALLLTLEEPPSHVVFILATTNIESVPITILSRCQRLDFKKISNANMENKLKEISKKEKISITDDAISEIAYCADGGLRDALSILDQLSKKGTKITDDIVLSSIGIVSNKSIDSLLDAIEDNNVEDIVNFIDDVRNKAIDYKSLIRKMIDNIKTRCIGIKKNTFSSKIGYSSYKNMSFELANTLYKANVNVDSYNMLELILLDYVSPDAIKQEPLEVKTEKNTIHAINESEPKQEEKYFPGNIFEFVDIRINNCFASAKKAKLKENTPKWDDYVKNNATKKLKGILMDSSVVLASDDIIVIKTELEENAQLINDNLNEISSDFKKIYDLNYLFVATFDDHWNELTEEYKKNISKGIKYKYIEEPKNMDEPSVLADIFSINKVEIK